MSADEWEVLVPVNQPDWVETEEMSDGGRARRRKYRSPIGPSPIGPTEGSLGTAMGSRRVLKAQIPMGIQPWDPK